MARGSHGSVNESTVNPSKFWADRLGIEDKETLERRLREDIRPEQEAIKALGTTEISLDIFQIKEACKHNLNLLSALAMPDVHRFDFPSTHCLAWQLLIDNEKKHGRYPQIALGIPRGHAKTTLIKLWLLRCILYTQRKFFLVIGPTEDHAINVISDVADMLDEDNIKAVFGDWRVGLLNDVKKFKKFGFCGRNITLAAVGSEGAVRGFNVKNERPDMMIFDDIQTKENAESPLMAKNLESWMVGTAMKAKSPTGCLFLFSGNMFPTPHSILKRLKTNPTWIKFISGAILADGTALWPALRSLESLLEEFDNDIAMGHPEVFFSEVLNDTDVGMNTQVDFSKFGEWKWTKEDLPQGKFLLIDPSQGKGMDADVIGRFEVYDGQLACRELKEDHLSPGNLIRTALIMAVTHNINLIAIEAMAYQSTLLYWFDQVCTTIGIKGINCVPIYTNSISKNSRITAGLKSLQSKEIILHPTVAPLVHKQIADWNPMKRQNVDDILDVISNATKVLAEYTYEMMSKENLTVIDAEGAKVQDNNHFF